MKKKTGVNLQNLCVCLLVILLVVVLVNVLTVSSIKKLLAGGQQTGVEKQGAAKVEVILLTAPECTQCPDLDELIPLLAQHPDLTFKTTENYTLSSPQGRKLIGKYNISRAPAIIITGDIEGVDIPGFSKFKDAMVFSGVTPYWDVNAGKTTGLVAVTYLKDSTCTKCQDLNLVISQLKQAGVAFSSEKTVEASSSEGKELAAKYNITRLPTLLFSNDLMAYDFARQVWNEIGMTADDGTMVMKQIPPPYYDSAEGMVRGLVDVTMLVDKTCKECYSPEMHVQILRQNLNLYVESNRTVEVSSKEGKDIIKNYKIELVPLIILSPEAAVYSNMAGIWQQIGTVEEDGSFVFRKVDLLSGITYKNLTSGSIVNSTG